MTEPVFPTYEIVERSYFIGEQCLRIQCIRDLNQTIDDLFAYLEKAGNPSLLEELCPYFGVVWPSAQALCQALAGEKASLCGLSILELGCGLGLPSLCCAKNGAMVTAVDFHPEVPKFLSRNISLNSISNLNFVHLDWRSNETCLGQYDRVIGSDILYESQHPEPVARTLARHCNPEGRIILADPARPYLQHFADEMKKLGFEESNQIIQVPDDPAPKEIFLMEFKRPTYHG